MKYPHSCPHCGLPMHDDKVNRELCWVCPGCQYVEKY